MPTTFGGEPIKKRAPHHKFVEFTL
ncbi:hypothetical protein ACMUG6_04870 [Staphylococcus aureus]